jgi:hypothetical protein
VGVLTAPEDISALGTVVVRPPAITRCIFGVRGRAVIWVAICVLLLVFQLFLHDLVNS